MSRLTDLIAQAKAKDPRLGADLDQEFKQLSSRLPFGLNFERHRPEAVELPQRPVRKGDKVRVLTPRGATKKGDPRLWQVKASHRSATGKVAELELLNTQTPEVRDQAPRVAEGEEPQPEGPGRACRPQFHLSEQDRERQARLRRVSQ